MGLRITTPALLILGLAAAFGCNSSRMQIQLDVRPTVAPGTVRVSENFLCDQSEVTNLQWMEFTYWVSHVYESESEDHKLLLDTAAWTRVGPFRAQYLYYYLRHPAYRDFPVVGITQEQAIAYSKWRSDRVFEAMLIQQKKIPYVIFLDQTSDDHFTIERYFNGEWKGMKPDPTALYYPEFRLPDLEERNRILQYSDSVNTAYFARCRSSFCKECAVNSPGYQTDVLPCVGDTMNGNPTRQVDQSCDAQTKWGIFNLRGNVGEWTSVPGVSAGGGWHDSSARILESDTFHVQGTNAWTGFRNVCEWKKWGE